ncbi:MerR family transcriptional regulator [Microbacterium esteraromaticum]|uniref:MerR family transcriptional regulator n=1 Tax=Microbacterium esteraromaticum TaxID=57043 RepID=A0A7D7WEB8_9MICO|nr:MerR family transcriptional regulator [Microbacterium esteraromaticum]QMU98635.1 MerR family transcriptional regulator [Microbacterium esteraromaticum]
MRIGDVAERTSLSLRTLRHYDEMGLVEPSARTHGGFRLYTEDDVSRLMLVRRMKPLGYTLEEMRELLLVVDAVRADPDDISAAARLDELRVEASDRRARLAAQVEMADEFLEQLDGV